jgi:serine/threonine-protein kinase RsbW
MMSAPVYASEPLRLRLKAPALPQRLADVRALLAAWAGHFGLSTDTVDDMVLATHEALANVADHAYPDGGGEAELEAVCTDGEIRVVVSDHGRWQAPAVDPGWRGRGLVIIYGLADQVDVRQADAGTSVAMRWRFPVRDGRRQRRSERQ